MYFNSPTVYGMLIGGAAAIVVSIVILLKDIRAPLNILFSSSLFFWGISLLFNALTFLYTSTEQFGVQFVRDVSTSSGCFGAFLVFITAYTMYKGLHYLKKWYFIVPLAVLCIVDIVITSLFDHVVTDTDFGGIKTTQEPWVMIFLYGIPAILIVLADIYFYLTQRQIEEPKIKTRILLFILGFILIILGVLIYAIFGILEQLIGFSTNTIEYLAWIFATLFWAAGPILQLFGFFIGKKIGKESKESDLPN